MNHTGLQETGMLSNVESVPFEDQTAINYKIWHTNYGDIAYLPYAYDHIFGFESQLWNATLVHSLFNKYWHLSFAFVVIYILAIFGVQKWMESRQPFTLSGSLTTWNFFLAIFSGIGTWRFGQEFVFAIGSRSLQDTICLSISPEGPAGFWAMCFALSKAAELLDTVFIVLRKRPLIFLHWYHHAAVLVYTWHGAKELTSAGRWFIFMNYFVHTLMYSYYTLTSAGYRLPKRMSMAVTTLQTVQMLIGVVIALFVVYLKLSFGPAFVCQMSNENLWLSFGIYLSFAALFINFFHKAYVVKRKRSGRVNVAVPNGKALKEKKHT